MKTSILTERINDIYTAKTVEEARAIFLEIVDQSRINDYSRQTMKANVNECTTLLDVQKYATNSMFKFEGGGVPKMRGA